jgi:uncharacterized protein with ATP-grasp and redox domains
VRSSLDCIPCFVRQAIDAARAVSDDPELHEATVREMLSWIAEADLDRSPPGFAQHIHRRLREMMDDDDPHRVAKQQHNAMALRLLPGLRTLVDEAADPLDTALRLAAAGNAIDLGVTSALDEDDLQRAIDQALRRPLVGDQEGFRRALEDADDILYLADNAGEIVLDKLLIERLGPSRVTVAVRGAPVLNDATLADAQAAGLDRIVTVIDNGSDAPGTVLTDCSEGFRQRFAAADLVLAKGQGNFESLSEEPRAVFFLFKVKCEVVANEVGAPVGTHLLTLGPRPTGAATATT